MRLATLFGADYQSQKMEMQRYLLPYISSLQSTVNCYETHLAGIKKCGQELLESGNINGAEQMKTLGDKITGELARLQQKKLQWETIYSTLQRIRIDTGCHSDTGSKLAAIRWAIREYSMESLRNIARNHGIILTTSERSEKNGICR